MIRSLGAVLTILATSLSMAQQAESPTLACADSAVYSKLNFWVGDWDVYVGDEKVGTNRIERILGGCAVMEHWIGGGGAQGKSLFYVGSDGAWRQVWVTEQATSPGGTKEKREVASDDVGRMRFQGEIALPDGRSYLDRTTLTPLESGDVRQVIEVSTDGGDSWRTVFDARYRGRE